MTEPAEISRLRVSHAELLEAAKTVLIAIDDEGSSSGDVSRSIEQLRATTANCVRAMMMTCFREGQDVDVMTVRFPLLNSRTHVKPHRATIIELIGPSEFGVHYRVKLRDGTCSVVDAKNIRAIE